MAVILKKYGAAAVISGVPLITAGSQDYQANPTLAAGDVKISKDDAALANLATLPTVAPAASTNVKVSLTVTELTCKRAVVTFIDAAGDEWEDQRIIIETYGHASAQHQFDLNSATVTVGTNNDKTGYALSAAGVQAVWDALTSALTTAGSIGKKLADWTILTSQAIRDAMKLAPTAGAPSAGAIDEHLDDLIARITAARAGYLDNLNIGGNVASSTEVLAIQNNTRVRVIIPAVLERPDSGSTLYKLHLMIYDANGNMEAPDSLPTITAENESGVDRSSNLGAVTLEATGHYSVTYTVATAHLIEQVLFLWTVVEGGASRLHGGASLVVDTTAVDFTAADRAKLDTLHDTRLTAGRATNLDNLDAAVTSRSSHGAADVWASATRTLSAAGVQAIWDALTSALTTAGSIGKKLADWVLGADNKAVLSDEAHGGGSTTITADVTGNVSGSIGSLGVQAKLDVNAEADTALADIKLDHLIAVAETDEPVDNSIVAKLAAKGATADWSTFNNTTDSLEAQADASASVNVTLGPVTVVTDAGNRVASPATLEMFQAEAKPFILTIEDSAGDPVDLSSKTLQFVVFNHNSPPGSVFKVVAGAITVSGASNEVANIPVSAAQAVNALADHDWALWDIGADEVLAHGPFTIYPAKSDV